MRRCCRQSNTLPPAAILVVGGVACLIALIAAPQRARTLDLKVQGESRLSAGVRSAGTRLIVTGTLRDDLRKPLPRRPVRVDVRSAETDEQVASETTDTSRQGAFSVSLDVPPGQYEVEVRFEPTSHVSGASTTRSISVVPEPMNLSLEAPDVVHPPVESVTLAATLLVDGLGVPADGYLEIGGERVQSIQFDASGLVRLDLAGRLEAGINRVRLVVPDDSHRSGTEAEIEILQLNEPRLDSTVSKVFARLQRGVEVAGTLSSDDASVSNTTVEVELRYEGERPPPPSSNRASTGDAEEGGASTHAPKQSSRRETPSRRVETDESGEFRAFFERSELRDGPWRARVRVLPDAGAPIERSVGTVQIDRTWTRWMTRGAGLLALLAFVVVGGREAWRFVGRKIQAYRRRKQLQRDRERAFEEDTELDPVRLEEFDGRERSMRSVRGRVHDVWRNEPVGGIEIELRHETSETSEQTETDAEGRFGWEELSDGDYVLEIHAEHFVDGHYTFSVPHDGTLAGARFDVVPIPLKIRQLYQTLIEMLRGDDLWGRLSPRDIEAVVREELEDFEPDDDADDTPIVERLREMLDDPEAELESGADYLEVLTDIVEETYFSGRTYTESTWELARRLALRLRDAARPKGEGS